MPNRGLSDDEYIALLEKRDEESRRTIRTLSSLLTSAMDRIEELQRGSSERSARQRQSVAEKMASSREKALLLDSSDIAELFGVSKATALKFIKSAGGVQLGSRWKIAEAKVEDFVSKGRHVDLN